MLLAYKARSIDGILSSGTIEAETIIDARNKLRQNGMFALTLEKQKSGSPLLKLQGTTKLSKNRLYLLTTQLGFLIKSGMDLSNAIGVMADRKSVV